MSSSPYAQERKRSALNLKLLHVIIFQLFFVGSTRFGQALTIVVRVIGNQWLIQDRLLKLEVLTTCTSTEELVQRLILSHCIIHLDQMVRQWMKLVCVKSVFSFVTFFLTWLMMLESTSNLVYSTHFVGTGLPCDDCLRPAASTEWETRTGLQ